jgi:hypothetical protein
VYRAASSSGPFTRLTTSLISATAYQDAAPLSGTATYLVRAVALQVNPSGSYFNPSQGTFVNVNSSGAGNLPPTISGISDQNLAENASTSPIGFTVGDTETPAANLILQGSSDDQLLVPNSGIAFGGSGQNRSVTITPASGQTGTVRIHISVSDGSASAETSFLLTVNASSNAAPSIIPGSYTGLFYEPDQVRQNSSGNFTLTVNARGNYSGKLQVAGRHYSFSGKLGDQTEISNTINRGHDQPLTVSFQAVPENQIGKISGQVTDGAFVADLVANRSPFNAKTNHAPWTGNYTIIFPGVKGDASLPAGDGYAVLRVTAAGVTSISGSLADGARFSQSATVSSDGLWPIYVPFNSGQGSLLGWIIFTSRDHDDLNGTVNWIKPANTRSRYYPAGFTEQIESIGSIYHQPPGTNAVLDLTSGTAGFSGGNLSTGFTNNITFGKGGHVRNESSNRLTMSFAPGTGRFNGSVTASTGGKAMSFSGVAFQRHNSAFGFMLGADQSSEVIIGP